MLADERIICGVCGRYEALMACDHCGKPLCPDCRKLELWGSGAEDLSAKYFCPACKDNPDVNPWGAREQDSVRKQAPKATKYGHGRRATQSAKMSVPLNKGIISNTY